MSLVLQQQTLYMNDPLNNLLFGNSAVYPSEPSELQFKISGTQTTLPLSVSNETLAALQSPQVGHSMITRFCRLVSQKVQACSG